jgi:glycosyltransferase involved in cell wall biosynthesis
MNIGFEAKRIFTNFTGLGNYGRFVVSSLADNFPENKYFLYTPRTSKHPDVAPFITYENIKVIKPGGIFSARPFSSIWRTWGISGHQSVKDINIFHGLSQELPVRLPKNVKRVVTVHDLIFLRYPKLYHPLDARIYLAKVKKACEVADCIVAISEQTADDIREKLSVSGDKIRVVYQGCNDMFLHSVAEEKTGAVLQKYALPDRYILNIGTIEERKNLVLAVKALSLIPEEDRIPLVVVGRKTPYFHVVSQLIDKLIPGNWVRFIHNASFTDLPAIYQKAELFVYPSLFEGFGIPLIEAIASRVPVVTSKGSCFMEAAGPAASYVDPSSPEHLASELMRICRDREVREQMVASSMEYIGKFSPSRIAADMMRVYREVS